MHCYPGRLVLAVFLFSSCLHSPKKEIKKDGNTLIRNGIVVDSKNIKVDQAFLLFDDGALVPDDNIIKLNQKVRLRLITAGWQENDSMVFLSGWEKVETDKGEVLLDNKDLFEDYQNGLKPEDARAIDLTVTITRLGTKVRFFRVSFKIKDENNPRNTVEGHCKLYL